VEQRPEPDSRVEGVEFSKSLPEGLGVVYHPKAGGWAGKLARGRKLGSASRVSPPQGIVYGIRWRVIPMGIPDGLLMLVVGRFRFRWDRRYADQTLLLLGIRGYQRKPRLFKENPSGVRPQGLPEWFYFVKWGNQRAGSPLAAQAGSLRHGELNKVEIVTNLL
jgi:hypothetical protein